MTEQLDERLGLTNIGRWAGAMLVCVALVACQAGKQTDERPSAMYFPAGDAVAGKAAFTRMQCSHCHAVADKSFAPPVASPPVPVRLDAKVASKSRALIAESIIAPSHEVAQDLKSVKVNGLSRMGDYGSIMTVRELTDIVAYLKALKDR